MQVVCVTASKGGSGKTTIAAHLAVAAVQDKVGKVALVDLDEQGSACAWHAARVNARRGNEPVIGVVGSGMSLTRLLTALRWNGHTLVIIDTPPAIRPIIAAAAALADLVLVPVQPSPLDIRAEGWGPSGRPPVRATEGLRGAESDHQRAGHDQGSRSAPGRVTLRRADAGIA